MPEAHTLRMHACRKHRDWISRIIVCFWWGGHFLDAASCLAKKSFEDDQQRFEFSPVFDGKPAKRNECRGYAIVFSQIEN